MRLWMIAEEALWVRLREEDELFCDPARIAPDFIPAYTWLQEECARRMPGYEGHHLWWAWVHWRPGRPRPDLRARRFHWFAPGTPAVRLELEVPDEQVLCTNYRLWEDVLFERSIDRPSGEAANTSDTMPEVTRAAMEASWEAIFDVPSGVRPERDALADCVPTVQAVFEVLRRDQVVRVTPFRSRPLRNRFRTHLREDAC